MIFNRWAFAAILIAAQLGTLHQGERALAGKLTSTTGPDMLVLAGRGFF